MRDRTSPTGWPASRSSIDDPDEAAAMWAKILNRPVDGRHHPPRRLTARSASCRSPTAAGPGVSAYDVKVVDRERVLAAADKRGRKPRARRRSRSAAAGSTWYEAAADRRQLPVALCAQGAGVPGGQGHRLRGRSDRAVLRRRPVLPAEPAAAHPGADRRRPGAERFLGDLPVPRGSSSPRRRCCRPTSATARGRAGWRSSPTRAWATSSSGGCSTRSPSARRCGARRATASWSIGT